MSSIIPADQHHILTYAERATTIANDLTELVGNTPLVYLDTKRLLGPDKDIKAKIAVKLEYINPVGSVKDRIALQMVLDAEKAGKLQPGSGQVILDGSSGNTTIGLAMVAASRGYKVACVMPCAYSLERRQNLLILGVDLYLSPSALGFVGLQRKCKQLMEEHPDWVFMNQFENPANVNAHELTTGAEIIQQTEGKVTHWVAASGTSGTFVGVAKALKKQPSGQVHCVIVEPEESPVLRDGPDAKGAHHIAGTGPGVVPTILDRALVDEIMTVHSDEAIAMARRLPGMSGLCPGTSGGCNISAALKLAERPENNKEGVLIVTLMASQVERYMSTVLAKEMFEQAKSMAVIAAEDLKEEGQAVEPLPEQHKEKTGCCC